jgi:hypothetical protein
MTELRIDTISLHMKRPVLFSMALYCLFAITSCSDKPNDNENKLPPVAATELPEGMVLWAEQVESQTDMIKPPDWTETDWNATYKGIDKEKIFNSIKEGVLSGKLQAYDYFFDTIMYTRDQMEHQVFSWTDTIYSENGDKKTVKNTLVPKDISTIKVKEKWFFDPKTYKMYKEVTDMAFFVNVYSEDGLVRGIQPLFYVRLGSSGTKDPS